MFGRNLVRNVRHASRGSLGIVDAGISRGQSKKGVDDGPQMIRAAGLVDELKGTFKITDGESCKFARFVQEDKKYPSIRKGAFKANQPNTVAAGSKTILAAVRDSVQQNERTLVLGGDHSMAIGTLLGHKMAYDDEFCVLWFDAHADINTPRTSASGNMHGQVLSYVVKELEGERLPKAFTRDWCRSFLPADRLAYIGLREVDDGEQDILVKHNIERVCMQQIRRFLLYCHYTKKPHMQWALDRCLKKINPDGSLPLHLSFDVDSLDPVYAPATGTAAVDGLYLKDIEYVGKELARRGIKIRVLDIAEVNPKLTNINAVTDATVTARTAVKVAGYLLNPQTDVNPVT